VTSRSLPPTCFRAGFFLGLFFDNEDGGDVFLRNVGWLTTAYMALYVISQKKALLKKNIYDEVQYTTTVQSRLV
jgi:hypothetical protein